MAAIVTPSVTVMVPFAAFADFRPSTESEVGEKNGRERVEYVLGHATRSAGEVRTFSQEHAGTGAIRQEKALTDNSWGFIIGGGGGGNRTRVQKHSTDSSTYLVLPFDLIRTTRTHTLRKDESPIF